MQLYILSFATENGSPMAAGLVFFLSGCDFVWFFSDVLQMAIIQLAEKRLGRLPAFLMNILTDSASSSTRVGHLATSTLAAIT